MTETTARPSTPPAAESWLDRAATSRRQIVTMSAVSRSFPGIDAVSNVSLQVEEGTILGLIGPSGSGKTTIVRMLTGSLDPTAGEVRVMGEVPTHFRRRTRERIGYMPQLFILYPELTAAENVSFVAALFGMTGGRVRRRVREVLELVDLWDARDREAKQLSGGMQRRLELACALVHDPSVLFIDEPTAGIDPVLRQSIWEEFRRLRDMGRTLFVTTQYVGEAEYCDQVAMLAQGRLIALAPPEQLRQSALGGEVLELQVARPIDIGPIAGVPGVKDVRETGPRTLLVIAEDAGAATPLVLQAVTSDGGQVVSSREYRPTFDEVFAELLARDQAQQARSSGESADVR